LSPLIALLPALVLVVVPVVAATHILALALVIALLLSLVLVAAGLFVVSSSTNSERSVGRKEIDSMGIKGFDAIFPTVFDVIPELHLSFRNSFKLVSSVQCGQRLLLLRVAERA
jgi:hypothetical protein